VENESERVELSARTYARGAAVAAGGGGRWRAAAAAAVAAAATVPRSWHGPVGATHDKRGSSASRAARRERGNVRAMDYVMCQAL